MAARWWQYTQNNSGGFFEGHHYMVVEALNPKHADMRAEENGAYFDGCETGRDCRCCGDRWHRSHGTGSLAPAVYDEPLDEFATATNPVFVVPLESDAYVSTGFAKAEG